MGVCIGPTSLPSPAGVTLTRVTTALEMRDAVLQNLASSQIVIKAAAVADFAPVASSPRKIKKEDGNELTLTFRKNPDILTAIASASPRPFVVAFAAIRYFAPRHALILEVIALGGFLFSSLMWVIVAIATPAPVVMVDAALEGARRVHERLPEEIRSRIPLRATGSEDA